MFIRGLSLVAIIVVWGWGWEGGLSQQCFREGVTPYVLRGHCSVARIKPGKAVLNSVSPLTTVCVSVSMLAHVIWVLILSSRFSFLGIREI